MSFSRHSAVGFSISALLHISLLVFMLVGGWGQAPSLQAPAEVPLTLSMFTSQPIAKKPANKPVTHAQVHAEMLPVETRSIPDKSVKVPVAKPVEEKDKPESEANPLAEPSKTDTAEFDATEPLDDSAIEAEALLASADPEQVGERVNLDPGLLSSIEEDYKSALRLAIEAKKFYPKKARRMRREGLVEVDFTIELSGLIKNISISSSSGVELLDNAALQAVQALRQFRPIPDELNRNQWPMRIPVEFSLLSI